MKKSTFAICDVEASFAYNFMEYFIRKKSCPFEIQAFTNRESLIAFAENHEIDLLLISNQAITEEIRQLKIGKIILLSEGEILEHYPDLQSVYKYQSSENIIREVLDYYVETSPAVSRMILKNEVQVIGIYSPVKRALKTSFALVAGQILAKTKKALYLNLEAYSGFQSVLDTEYESDLSDLLYYARQQGQNVMARLPAIVRSFHGLDYVPPVKIPTDIAEAGVEDWQNLLDEIILKTEYEVLIIDFSDSVQGLPELLNRCTAVYVPVLEDAFSKGKMEQFEAFLKASGREILEKRLIKIRPPFVEEMVTKGYHIDQLLWNEFGEYVRNVLRGDG